MNKIKNIKRTLDKFLKDKDIVNEFYDLKNINTLKGLTKHTDIKLLMYSDSLDVSDSTREQWVNICKENNWSSTPLYLLLDYMDLKARSDALQKFHEFLEFNGIFDLYFSNQSNEYRLKIKDNLLCNAIFETGFSWKNSEKGFNYWNGLDGDWKKICKENKWTNLNLNEVLYNTEILEPETPEKGTEITTLYDEPQNSTQDVIEETVEVEKEGLETVDNSDKHKTLLESNDNLYNEMLNVLFDNCKEELYNNTPNEIHRIVDSVMNNIPDNIKQNIVKDYIKTLK